MSDELQMYKDAFPVCEKHAPNGGRRANCLECAYAKLSYALSRIDYVLEKPNEYEVSVYDLDCDEERVLVHVKSKMQRIEYLEDLLSKCSLMLNHVGTLKLSPDEALDWWAKQGEIQTSIKKKKPKVVCLCGSTKFKQHFIDENFKETMSGNIVLSVGFFAHADHAIYTPTELEKQDLDELHKRKIDIADEVFVINVNGYVGDSTRSEIEYAIKHGKAIRYLEPVHE